VSGPERVMLAAGGTGGHILPAVAFGKWLFVNHPGVEVCYMSGSRRIELEIYRSLKIEPLALKIEGSPVGAPWGKKLRRWKDLIRSVSQATKIMKEKRPELCVLFGGYSSFAALMAAIAGKIPAIIHEQNADAGRVTRIALFLGISIASGWENCHPLARKNFVRVGVPIRPIRSMEKDEAIEALGLNAELADGPAVAVMTGSLGSEKLTKTMEELSSMDGFASWSFLAIDHEADAPKKISRNFTRLPKMWDIAPLYNIADILITRGGASTLAEVEASGLPSIIVPWRRASGDHQMKNAMELARLGRAGIWDEDSDKLADLAEKLKKLHRSHGATRRDIGKRMYNASENICERLWNHCCGLREGRGWS
jgi:UDP-N-acetylglucosamine--N-acetylmuramyl-(pentapeptide) pyrophosphoryl-undecaprenol N-acetylglucosamine transferase